MSKLKIQKIRLREMQKSNIASSQNSFADLIKMAGLDKSHPDVFDNSEVNKVVTETERERPVTLLESYESGRKDRVRKYERAHKKDRQSKVTKIVKAQTVARDLLKSFNISHEVYVEVKKPRQPKRKQLQYLEKSDNFNHGHFVLSKVSKK